MAEDLQWLTEKHYLVCPKGAMFKQMKVTSQNQVTFSGNLAATTADTMKDNVFICLGSTAFAAGAAAGLLVAALALMAVPVAGWALALIIGAALLLAIGVGYMKCKANASARIWVNSSPNLMIHGNEGLVVKQSQLSCPPEGALIDIKETFWEAMASTTMHNVGHIANFAFGFLAGRGMGSMAGTAATSGLRAAGAEFLSVARAEMGNMFNPASLFGKMGWLCRGLRGLGMAANYKAQYDIWSDPDKNAAEKLLASGQELILAVFAAKGASLVCFPAGTLVHTNNGLVPIENITEGSIVWTVNEATGQRELKAVKETHRRTTLTMMVIELENSNILEVTPEHRFFVNGDWRAIEHITIGEELELVDGEKVRLKNSALISKSANVFNFDVEDNENYFVTEDGVLVHNGYSGRRPAKPAEPVLDADGNLTEYGKWYYERPGWRNKTINDTWKNAKASHPEGKVIDPLSQKEITWDKTQPRGDQWHMGHKEGYEFSKHQQSAAERGIGVKDYRDEYNTAKHIQPELPESNISHQGEAPKDVYYGF